VAVNGYRRTPPPSRDILRVAALLIRIVMPPQFGHQHLIHAPAVHVHDLEAKPAGLEVIVHARESVQMREPQLPPVSFVTRQCRVSAQRQHVPWGMLDAERP